MWDVVDLIRLLILEMPFANPLVFTMQLACTLSKGFILPALLQKLVGELFFDFSQGNLGNLVGILAGMLWEFF